MQHSYTINTIKRDELTISLDNYYREEGAGNNTQNAACVALNTLLQFCLGMAEGVDYFIINSSSYQTLGWKDTITVTGKIQVIRVLDLILNAGSSMFKLRWEQDPNYYKNELNRNIFIALMEEGLTPISKTCLLSILNKTLDNMYTRLRNEPWVQSLTLPNFPLVAAENYLHHPFYKLLAHCFEIEKIQRDKFLAQSFIHRRTHKEPAKNGTALGDEYCKIGIIPPCFLKGSAVNAEVLITSINNIPVGKARALTEGKEEPSQRAEQSQTASGLAIHLE